MDSRPHHLRSSFGRLIIDIMVLLKTCNIWKHFGLMSQPGIRNMLLLLWGIHPKKWYLRVWCCTCTRDWVSIHCHLMFQAYTMSPSVYRVMLGNIVPTTVRQNQQGTALVATTVYRMPPLPCRRGMWQVTYVLWGPTVQKVVASTFCARLVHTRPPHRMNSACHVLQGTSVFLEVHQTCARMGSSAQRELVLYGSPAQRVRTGLYLVWLTSQSAPSVTEDSTVPGLTPPMSPDHVMHPTTVVQDLIVTLQHPVWPLAMPTSARQDSTVSRNQLIHSHALLGHSTMPQVLPRWVSASSVGMVTPVKSQVCLPLQACVTLATSVWMARPAWPLECWPVLVDPAQQGLTVMPDPLLPPPVARDITTQRQSSQAVWTAQLVPTVRRELSPSQTAHWVSDLLFSRNNRSMATVVGFEFSLQAIIKLHNYQLVIKWLTHSIMTQHT